MNMKKSMPYLIVILLLSGCCGMGSISEETIITFISKSKLYPNMTIAEAESNCQLETDGALAIWRRQCSDPTQHFDVITASAPPIAKRMTQPLNALTEPGVAHSLKRHCEDLQKNSTL